MVNHVRNVLLNELPDPSADLEQYCPPDFRPIALPYDAAAVQSLLIDRTWPRPYRNFVATLLAVLALDSEFRPLLDSIDSRTTLDGRNSHVATLQDRIGVQRISGASTLGIVGEFASRPAAGIFRGAWSLTGSGTTISILDLTTEFLQLPRR